MSNIGEFEEEFEIQPLWLPDEKPIEEPKQVPENEPVLVPVKKDEQL